ncbi:hypothetical protein [Lacipirellula parvula]|uniref:Peptidase S1 domain-containing protein n=1 Tax=Lacipirellula parvula TaxID=2650471 RepID=A0A5K7XC37_9BACT|nr:hypothetical protein [Lacipirellula parvula]BBO33587.1 hypothetical protein PLANPX_3199 [Lacipirellula parvula]
MRKTSVIAWLALGAALHGGVARADLEVHGVNVGVDPDRFDRFGGGTDFIGDGIDWSGVGRVTSSSSVPGPGFATMISKSFFVTAAHTVNQSTKAAGATMRFYPTNSSSTSVDRTISDGWLIGDDLWLGKLSSPVPNTIKPFPILNIEDVGDYVGQEIYLMGQSASAGVADNSLRQRIGRNTIDASDLTVATTGGTYDNMYKFTFNATRADLTGPDGVGDGLIDQWDWDAFESGFDPGQPGKDYFDGDVTGDGYVDLADGNALFNAASANANGKTKGFGWDEAHVSGGDSGAPSFRIINGKAALVGTHTASSGATNALGGGKGYDRLTAASIAAIKSQVSSSSSGNESPASIMAARGTAIARREGLTLPEGLRGLNLYRGDLTGDYVDDDDDIDLLNKEIAAYAADATRPVNWGFDIDGDGDVDASDRTAFLEQEMGTKFGDRDLDGEVEYTDDVLPAYNNVTVTNVGWAGGDFNGNGVVSFVSDVNAATANIGYKGVRALPDLDFAGSDDSITADDIDSLTAAWRSGLNNAAFDLTFDGIVDEDDYVFYITEVLGTLQGDLNFDGKVSFNGDLEPILTLGYATGTGWAEGDVNGDGDTDQDDVDFILGVIGSGMQFAPAPDLPVLPVPEPNTASMLAICSLAAILFRRGPA